MTIYICLLVAYTIIAGLSEHYVITVGDNYETAKKISLFFLLLPLFVTVAFRDSTVGNDTANYRYLFETYGNMSFLSAISLTSKEIGFVSMNYLAYKIGFSYIEFQILIAFITYFALYIYLKKYSMNYALSILVFICMLGYFRSMNISREMLAAVLALNALDLYIDKKKVKFLVVVLSISLIHRTVLVLLFLFLYELLEKLGPLRKVILALVSIGAYFSINELFQLVIKITGRYEYLYDSKYMTDNGIIAMLSLLIFTILFMYLEKRFCTYMAEIDDNSIIVKRSKVVSFAYAICVVFCIIGFRFGLADRVVIIFGLLFMETIGHSSQRYLGNMSRIYWLIRCLIIIAMIIYFILVMCTRNIWQGTIPYTFWQG